MLCYFGATFFSLMKIMEDNNSNGTRKALLLISYIVFIVNIIIPILLTTLIFRRFEILKVKEAKQSFNTLLLKIDTKSLRRLSVMLHTIVKDGEAIALQVSSAERIEASVASKMLARDFRK